MKRHSINWLNTVFAIINKIVIKSVKVSAFCLLRSFFFLFCLNFKGIVLCLLLLFLSFSRMYGSFLVAEVILSHRICKCFSSKLSHGTLSSKKGFSYFSSIFLSRNFKCKLWIQLLVFPHKMFKIEKLRRPKFKLKRYNYHYFHYSNLLEKN